MTTKWKTYWYFKDFFSDFDKENALNLARRLDIPLDLKLYQREVLFSILQN